MKNQLKTISTVGELKRCLEFFNDEAGVCLVGNHMSFGIDHCYDDGQGVRLGSSFLDEYLEENDYS